MAPGWVFDEILANARMGPGSTVLEIGPGTGQATRVLAEAGLGVLAVELSAALAERARRNVAGFSNVIVETASFEDWEPAGRRFDAVFACNSWHWIEPGIAIAKAAELLNPNGHLIVMSTPMVIPDDAGGFWWDVQDDWVAVGAERVDPVTAHPDVVAGYGRVEIDGAAPGSFATPIVLRRRFDREFTSEDYVMNQSTQSGVKELPGHARAELLRRVRNRIEALGGTLIVHYLAHTVIASRAA